MVFNKFLYHSLYNETYNPPVLDEVVWFSTNFFFIFLKYHCLYNETYKRPVAPVAAAALPPEAENAPSRTGKHSGPEGRNSAKIEPKKSLTSLLKP